ncbi:MAG: hypothetical protein RL755_75 [Pseudomonadota bacterium]|jgi:hypothetical protein
MKLFVANLTKQRFKFHYRLPENPKLLDQDIPIGKQIQIAGDLTRDVIDIIVSQHEDYGILAANEVYGKSHDNIKAPIVYSVGEPVDLDKLFYGISQNDEVAQKMADDSKVATTAAILEALPQANAVVLDTVSETTEHGVTTSKTVSSMGRKSK